MQVAPKSLPRPAHSLNFAGSGVGAGVRLFASRLLQMAAELEAHRREQLVLVVGLTARKKSFVKRGAQHWDWHAFVDSSLDCPPAFTGVGNAAGKVGERRIFAQRCSRQ